MCTKSEQVASLLETYLIRDVSKIVWQYFFDGLDVFLYGAPRFKMWVERYEDLDLYYDEEDDFLQTGPDYDKEELNEFLQTMPDVHWDKQRKGKINVCHDSITLTFSDRFTIPKVCCLHHVTTAFFIIEITTGQIIYSWFPRLMEEFAHPAFEVYYCDTRMRFEWRENGKGDHKKTTIKLYLSADSMNKKVKPISDSKYPL